MEEGVLKRWVLRASERREESEEEERETSRWREWEREKWWEAPEEKGVITWKWSEDTAELRKEERREGEDDVKVGPTSFTVMGTESWRERREAGVGELTMEG